MKGLVRALKSSTEPNLRTAIGPSLPLIPWIIEYVAQLKNKYMVGADFNLTSRLTSGFSKRTDLMLLLMTAQGNLRLTAQGNLMQTWEAT